MNKPALQILDRVELLLLTEARSRLGDNGRILEGNEIPNDGSRRVFVGEVLTGTYKVGRTPSQVFRPINQLCVQGMQSLVGASDVVWCFGEERLDRILQMKLWLGNTVRHCVSSRDMHVFIFPMESRLDNQIGDWPILRNEYSLHAFAISDKHGRVSQILNAIYDSIEKRPDATVTATYQLMERCLSRSGVAALLREVPIMLLPDGSHFQFPGMHTDSIEIDNIVHVFAALARTYGFEFSHEENIGRRYVKFFQRGSSIIMDG